jgi:hypothetical protein
MKRAILLLSLLVAAGCRQEKDPEIPAPPPAPASDPAFCAEACAQHEELGCEEGEPVYNSDLPGPAGEPNQSCEEWCVEMQERGSALNPACTRLVSSCDQIEEYRLRDPAECLDK